MSDPFDAGGQVTHEHVNIHVLRVPTKPIRVEQYAEGTPRWCFICRKRVPFTITTHVPIDEMSYYGPHWTVECPEGHVDGDCFPGTTREWE